MKKGWERTQCSVSWKRLESFMKSYYDLGGLNVCSFEDKARTTRSKICGDKF